MAYVQNLNLGNGGPRFKFCTYAILDLYVRETLQQESEYYTLALGDWNAKVGQERENGTTIEKCGMVERNENGNKLISLAVII